MSTWHRVQGDVGDTIVMRLDGVATLDGVSSVVAHVKRTGSPSATLSAAVTDAAERLVIVQLGGVGGWLADADVGTWQLETEVTYLNGAVLTWSQRVRDRVIVHPQLA